MAVKVTLKRGVHDLTPQVEPFDGDDDEYWFEEQNGKTVLRVWRAADETVKSWAYGEWLNVDGKVHEPGIS